MTIRGQESCNQSFEEVSQLAEQLPAFRFRVLERGKKGSSSEVFFFLNRWLQRISRILAVLGYEGIKQATPVVLRPKRKSSAHSL